jgi:glycosyltransferase involved in cell wall biosynthesis
MLIAFTHAFKAFLPEIAVYRQFFEKYGIETVEANIKEAAGLQPDVEWRFMGTHFKKSKATLLIHEYASASLPPFRNTKDLIKSRFTVKPHFRLFLNEYVAQQFSFSDNVPFGFRDMGVNLPAFDIGAVKKEYDFIYVGSVSREMQMERLLDCFTRPNLRYKKILVLSKNYEVLQRRYNRFSNIIFKGPVPQAEVSRYIAQSSFALNYKPNIAPHSHQTSTKLLEYAACGIPVITTDFPWVREFEKKYGGKYFFLDADLSNFEWESVNAFEYSFPNLEDWSWENQIRKSGILKFLGITD